MRKMHRRHGVKVQENNLKYYFEARQHVANRYMHLEALVVSNTLLLSMILLLLRDQSR